MLNVNGDVKKIDASFYLRDHDKEKYEFKKSLIEEADKLINLKNTNR